MLGELQHQVGDTLSPAYILFSVLIVLGQGLCAVAQLLWRQREQLSLYPVMHNKHPWDRQQVSSELTGPFQRANKLVLWRPTSFWALVPHQVVNTSSCKACSATESSVTLHCISVCLPHAIPANLMNYLAMPCWQAHANTVMEFCTSYGYSQMFTIFLPLSAQILCKLQEEQHCHHHLLH